MHLKSLITPLLALALAIVLAGCVSSKKATSSQATSQLSEASGSSQQQVAGVRAKTSVTLSVDGGKDMSLSGSLRMARGQMVQLSLTALGLMEVARLELTPQGVLLMDRYHHRYLQLSWDEVQRLDKRLKVLGDTPYQTIEALCWGTASDQVVQTLSAQGVAWSWQRWAKVEETPVPELSQVDLQVDGVVCHCTFHNTSLAALTTAVEPTTVDTTKYTSVTLKSLVGLLKQ